MSDYISVQTGFVFPLASVKPLDGLRSYREHCLGATRKALERSAAARGRCPACHASLAGLGDVDGLDYVRCSSCDSLFLRTLPAADEWARLLADVSLYRRSPEAFHSGITQSRVENVYAPKLEWIQDTLRLQGVRRPRVLEVVTRPSDFTELARGSGLFADVLTVDETELATTASMAAGPGIAGGDAGLVEIAVLLESLDRAHDPVELLRAVSNRLVDGGLVFITAVVASGFDIAVLGLRNLYIYPPDRANCFSRHGLELLLTERGFTLLEVSTPGVLDVEIVQAHAGCTPSLSLSAFERQLVAAGGETRAAFQSFLQQRGLSSFARIVAKMSA